MGRTMSEGTAVIGPTVVRAGFAEAVRAEWTKFRTIRGTVISALAVIAAGAMFGLLFGFSSVREYIQATPVERADFDPALASMRPFVMGMIASSVMGVLAVTSEYASGTIRASAVAIPSRPRLFAAKAAVVGGVALVVGQIAAFAAFLLPQAVLSAHRLPYLALGDPGVLRAIIGGGVCLALMALFGVAVGFLLRFTSGAAAITTVVTILPALADVLLPERLADLVTKYWPSSAGLRVLAIRPDPDLLSPWPGLALLYCYVVVLLGIALAAFRARDV